MKICWDALRIKKFFRRFGNLKLQLKILEKRLDCRKYWKSERVPLPIVPSTQKSLKLIKLSFRTCWQSIDSFSIRRKVFILTTFPHRMVNLFSKRVVTDLFFQPKERTREIFRHKNRLTTKYLLLSNFNLFYHPTTEYWCLLYVLYFSFCLLLF